MQQITAITDDPNQTSGIILDDGSVVQMTLQYIPAQQCWFISLSYGAWEANFMRLVVSPNMLRKYRRVIPFGLAITTIDGYEVINQSDFVSGRASMFSLNQSDIKAAETLITQTLPNLLGSFIQ